MKMKKTRKSQGLRPQRLPWDPQDRNPEGYSRPRSDSPYHSWRWTKLAKAWKIEHPLCEECKRKGIIRPAEVADHIIPWPICEDFFDTSNLQSLCAECNMLKGIRDRDKIQAWKREHKSG